MNVKKLINVPRILFPVGTEVLIKGKIVGLNVLDDRFVENVVKLAYGEQIIAPNDAIYVKDEPETGHADKAPRYLKNILARLRELPEHDREVWLKVIMGEFEEEFSHAKWCEGYEQGKLEGMVEREKVKVPQCVAEIIEYYKGQNATLYDALREKNFNKQYNEWLMNEQDAYNKVARAWLDGYEVEKEKLVKVRLKGTGQHLCNDETGLYFQHGFKTDFTKDYLEEAGFGWVFDCPGIEMEEVE